MKWKVVALPQAQVDLLEAADWYDFTSMGLGVEFIKAILMVFDALAVNPLLHSKRHQPGTFAGALLNVFHIASFMRCLTLSSWSLFSQLFTMRDTIKFGRNGSRSTKRLSYFTSSQINVCFVSLSNIDPTINVRLATTIG